MASSDSIIPDYFWHNSLSSEKLEDPRCTPSRISKHLIIFFKTIERQKPPGPQHTIDVPNSQVVILSKTMDSLRKCLRERSLIGEKFEKVGR
jgi:hypothetical protein